jgi:hypothetical protein
MLCREWIELLAQLKNLSNLKRLDLSCNGIGDGKVESIVKLQRLPNLEFFSLCFNTLSDDGVKQLAQMQSPQNLARLKLVAEKVDPSQSEKKRKYKRKFCDSYFQQIKYITLLWQLHS